MDPTSADYPPPPPAPPRRRLADAPATVTLIALNALVWVAILATGGSVSRLVVPMALEPTARCLLGTDTYVGMSAAECVAPGGSFVPGVADGAYWQLVTSMFTHVQPAHIGLNMLTLWFLGRPLERSLGIARYLLLYLLSGLAGSVAVYWLSDPESTTLGASGAIFGLMGALLVIALRTRRNAQELLTWLAINLVFTFMPGTGVSWQGHLGGLLGGCLVTWLLVGPLRDRARWLALAALAVVLVVAALARTAVLR